MSGYLGLCVMVLSFRAASAVHEPDSWQPLLHSSADLFQSAGAEHSGLEGYLDQGYQHQDTLQGKDQCEIYKVGFTQDLYFQYIQYKANFAEMKEFTLCFWSKFANHSNDHPIFSYALDGQPRAILSWISNTERSSYFSLSVEGHTLYRLNYPLRLNRWYHTCQSWNGKTGEWQIWVNAERVGRGFHNRLVGHIIPSGGIAISGQEQSQLGGGFQEGHEAPPGSGGMLGEITMIQLYNVALTAGKAHKDHKHHHAHHYDHNGNIITTPAPTTPNNRPTLPPHPLLTGGQLNHRVRINFAGGQPQQPQIVQGQDYSVQFVNGQLVGNLLTQQLAASQKLQPTPLPQQPEYQYPGQSAFSSQSLSLGNIPLINSGLTHSSLVNPANVQFVDNSQIDTHSLFKRGSSEESSDLKELKFGDKIKRETKAVEERNPKKRELFIAGGTIFEDSLLGENSHDQSTLLGGLAGITDNQPILQKQKDDDDREPAEAEVKAVMNVCSGCDEEPFDKALVFGWRTVAKKLYSGAFYTPAVPQCRVF